MKLLTFDRTQEFQPALAEPDVRSGSARRRSHLFLFAVPALVALCSTSSARADQYAFNINGSGITSQGTIQVANTGPLGAYTVTGISGTFADANNGFSGAITGMAYAPAPTFNPPPAPANTFGAPAFSPAGFSYDNLFWPDGDSPAICKDALAFFGGDVDIYGWVFNVAGGYSVNLWSDGALGGYQVGDALGSTKLSPSDVEGVGYGVNVTTAATPEPGSVVLLATGLSGLVAVARRRRSGKL